MLRKPDSRQTISKDLVSTTPSTSTENCFQQNASSHVINNFYEEIRTAQNIVQIHGSETIRVGDVIYNHYSQPRNEAFNRTVIKNKSSEKSSRTGSTSSSKSSLKTHNVKLTKCSQIFRRKRSIIALTFFTAFIGTLIGVTIICGTKKIDNQSQQTTTTITTAKITTKQPPINPALSTTTTSEITTLSETTTQTFSSTDQSTSIESTTMCNLGDGENLADFSIKGILTAQTGGQLCENQSDCLKIIEKIRSSNNPFQEISSNFLIGGKGNIYKDGGFVNQWENVDGASSNRILVCICCICTLID